MAASGASGPFKAGKDFKWERMSHLEQVGAKLRVKEGPKKSYNKRYVAIVYNYLVYFKEPKTPKPGPKDLGCGVLELELCFGEDSVAMVNGDKGGAYVLSVTAGSTVHFLAFDDMASMQSWMGTIKNHIRKLKAFPRDNSALLHDKLRRAETTLRSESMKTPEKVEPKDGAQWVTNMVQLKQMYQDYEPSVRCAGQYFEFQYENATRRYLQWFLDEQNGPRAKIEASETAVLENWKQRIEEGPGDMAEATKRYFFYEDIKPYLALGRVFQTLVNTYQSAMQALRGDQTPYYQDLVQTVQQVASVIETTPAASSVKFDQFKDSQLINANNNKKWQYYKYDGLLKTEVMGANIPEPCSWEIKAPHVYQHPTLYGTVMFNGRTWVWTHQNFPFLIRYEYDEASGIFQQNMQAVPKDMTAGPTLVDWQVQGNIIRAVTVGEKPVQPLVPEDVQWTLGEGMPPSLALLVCTMYVIKPLVRGEIKVE